MFVEEGVLVFLFHVGSLHDCSKNRVISSQWIILSVSPIQQSKSLAIRKLEEFQNHGLIHKGHSAWNLHQNSETHPPTVRSCS